MLARLADNLLSRARRGTDQMSEALQAVKCIGDATSLALLGAGGKGMGGDRGEAIARIRKRVSGAQSDSR